MVQSITSGQPVSSPIEIKGTASLKNGQILFGKVNKVFPEPNGRGTDWPSKNDCHSRNPATDRRKVLVSSAAPNRGGCRVKSFRFPRI